MTAIIDIEADSTDSNTAKLKYFGGLDIETGEITLLDHTKKKDIKKYISDHKVLIGFNIKGYDIKVLENFGIDFKYKVMLDLWQSLAPKGDNGFGAYNKDRLKDLNPELKLKDYKLKTIINTLGLSEEGKGDIVARVVLCIYRSSVRRVLMEVTLNNLPLKFLRLSFVSLLESV